MNRRNAILATGCLAGLCACMHGCNLIAWAAQPDRNGTHTVEAEYEGLKGKSVAVVVSADRSIQSEFPTIVEEITARTNARLAKFGVAASYADTKELLGYLYNRPQWTLKPLGELAKELQVDRLIYVELREFRLHEAGNHWTWDGAASGVVAIIEADSPTPDEFTFQKPVSVHFPDIQGQGPAQIEGVLVQSELLVRFVDRAAWLMFRHEEPNEPKY